MARQSSSSESTLFDVYRGSNLPEGTRSLAYRVRFSSDERTLSESDVASARSAVDRARRVPWRDTSLIWS